MKLIETVYAHCDIPCGIYSDHPSQIAADTVVKMNEKIAELGEPPHHSEKEKFLAYHNSLTRMILVKEQHAELCKREILILWTDYFKPAHLEKYPDLHEQIWKACKLASKNKQEINMQTAKELQEAVHEIGHIFSETKK
ncbi:MAG: superoxide dismutase, Ni [Candidatus Doudnabacteria bacterium RIFCSPHIGHO2_02_FULL_48_21]|uniref:Superoxide dismutase, Ni n=1 Tax=Candidatus Doudnabacteria bacterium RIFCSPLOWO2_02_FULL_48_13 TaxID=1817845 RepID=A0A1F5QC86_9BACT|nr:MAG: superoxide dismutase, Ni [Candidatus Doudnabacteria bacterium RIFCSPHIGHO2_01_48_18]OGE77719.1 MAG: superoxide dismutase, Ni [Candidatus Doudnabacteria bacterium RIFCSPHIGHO2_01_FULL_48_180]OGE91640.1 MAG: superoxide dismutase, Ni [Candidatus Doudnabacteria bacterium RIFCSPHIGHO2_12_FULL_47_25]OGE93254.1 MAG: superoxide dismutase, Ni [Candidatus Doudnabacteria bacterium RIFCSPHIGHO2_02_FULL_48_21]OGE99737.1 MAG: superoxide dismutase, Ni [Candidatus Doudnabacteria bacterium RIFCSPLOWO2_0